MRRHAFYVTCGNCGDEFASFGLADLCWQYAEHVKRTHPSNSLHLPAAEVLTAARPRLRLRRPR